MSRRASVSKVRHTIANGAGYYDLHLPLGEQAGAPTVLAGGFLTVPIDYENMAEEMASAGHPVLTPNLLDPLPGEPHDDPLRYRLTALQRSMEDAARRYGWDTFRSTGHSFGGPTQAQLASDSPHQIERMDFVSAVGFDNAIEGSRIHQLETVVTFGLTELLPSIFRQVHSRSALRRLREVVGHMHPHDVELRVREAHAIQALGAFNLAHIEAGLANGVKSVVHGGPSDHLVSWHRTKEVAEPVVGADNIREIHTRGNHLAPQDFARHVARHILDAVHDATHPHAA